MTRLNRMARLTRMDRIPYLTILIRATWLTRRAFLRRPTLVARAARGASVTGKTSVSSTTMLPRMNRLTIDASLESITITHMLTSMARPARLRPYRLYHLTNFASSRRKYMGVSRPLILGSVGMGAES